MSVAWEADEATVTALDYSGPTDPNRLMSHSWPQRDPPGKNPEKAADLRPALVPLEIAGPPPDLVPWARPGPCKEDHPPYCLTAADGRSSYIEFIGPPEFIDDFY